MIDVDAESLPQARLSFPWNGRRDPSPLRSREWLVTNGLGGYASGTLLGMSTRRYHGLFVPHLPAPWGRTVLIPRLDEELDVGRRRIRLSGAAFGDGSVEGEGHRWLREFRLDWQVPTWIFAVEGCTLQKRIVMPHGQNTVYLEYTLREGTPVHLHLRPFIACRGHDRPLDRLPPMRCPLTVEENRYTVQLPDGAPAMRLCLRPRRGTFIAEPLISSGVLYEVERERGDHALEDLWSPGYLTLELTPGDTVALVASVEPWELLEADPQPVFASERLRMERLLARAPKALQQDSAACLVLAADQFIIRPTAQPERAPEESARSVIAGYHWFTDWGRDTMISLEGLTLCTGRHEEARAILQTFAGEIVDGLLPNHFLEGERRAVYHTADATLWYFHALDRYLHYTGDWPLLRELSPRLESVIAHHVRGTSFGIGMDEADGLLKAGAPGYALTWMDARVEEWVVTPRQGKPVEIQALWYNALRLMARWAEALGTPASPYDAMAERAYASFNARFWFPQGPYLLDVVDTERGDDASLRPNQIFSMSLRFPILQPDRWQAVLETVTERLLTPFGLRTLDAADPGYRPRYEGDRRARDGAYHQGLVWAWLFGHFLDAWKARHPGVNVRGLVGGFEEHLREAGIGTISELFDAEPPHTPRGCIAQAWSVAEVLRCLAWADGPPPA